MISLRSRGFPEFGRKAVVFAPVLLFFISYPLVLVAPTAGWTRDVFDIDIRALFIVSMIAGACLLIMPLRAKGPPAVKSWYQGIFPHRIYVMRVCVIGFAGLCIVSAVTNFTPSIVPVIELLGYVAVPVYIATCPRRMLPRRLPLIFSFLWALNVAAGLLQWFFGDPVVGLAANWNWFAPLLIGLLPWTWLGLRWFFEKGGNFRFAAQAGAGQARSGTRPGVWIGIVMTVAVTLFLAWQTQCRASVVVVGAYVFLFLLLPRCTRIGKAVLVCGACIFIVLVAVLYSERVQKSWDRDIRPPLYTSTLRMIGDSPVAGVGPGNFRRDYPRYRTKEQQRRPVEAPVSEHPHNEVLHVFSQVGVPAGMLWLGLLSTLLCRPPRKTLFWYAVHFTAFVVVGHAMFDKTLVQPPLHIVGFFALGLLWRPRCYIRAQGLAIGKYWRGLCRVMVVCAAVVYTAFVVIQDLRHDIWLRRGEAADRNQNAARAYHAYARAAAVWPSDVKMHMLAAIRANSNLDKPSAALQHVSKALAVEPDYAQVNEQAGFALASMGKFDEAVSYYKREAELYPFKVRVRKRMLYAKLKSGDTHGIPELCTEYRDAWVVQAQRRFEGDRLKKVAAEWADGLRDSAFHRTLNAAGRMKDAVYSIGADADFYMLFKDHNSAGRIAESEFTGLDYRYWYRLALWHEQVIPKGQDNDPHRLVKRFTDFWQTRINNSKSSAVTEIFSPYVQQGSLQGNTARAFAECAFQAGYRVGVVGIKGEVTGLVQLFDGNRFWLVRPADGALWSGVTITDLRRFDDVRQNIGLEVEESEWLRLLVPVLPFDFLVRTQALGAVLRSEVSRVSAPRFGVTPVRRTLAWQERLGMALLSPLSSSFETSLVQYDAVLFQRVIKDWEEKVLDSM